MTTNLEVAKKFAFTNESKVKFTAAAVFILGIIQLLTNSWILPAFLVVDFILRGFDITEYSLLHIVSDNLLNTFNVNVKPIDQAPILFAAKLGFALAILMLASNIFNWEIAETILTALLMLLAGLEAFLGISPGAHLMKLYYKFTGKNKRTKISI